jgi:F-type H+-transporting ATPase subunit alpha
LNKVQEFEREFLMVLELSHKSDVLDPLKSGIINDDITAILKQVAIDVTKRLTV